MVLAVTESLQHFYLLSGKKRKLYDSPWRDINGILRLCGCNSLVKLNLCICPLHPMVVEGVLGHHYPVGIRNYQAPDIPQFNQYLISALKMSCVVCCLFVFGVCVSFCLTQSKQKSNPPKPQTSKTQPNKNPSQPNKTKSQVNKKSTNISGPEMLLSVMRALSNKFIQYSGLFSHPCVRCLVAQMPLFWWENVPGRRPAGLKAALHSLQLKFGVSASKRPTILVVCKLQK